MMDHRPSNEINSGLVGEEPLNEQESPALLAFTQELEALLGPVPPREERRARANRSAFLTAAADQFTTPVPAPARWQGWWRRLLLQGTTLVLFFSVSWMSARVASAGSLPGDTLYPVKLTVEQIDLLLYDEAQWETQVQSQRLSEVLTLLQSGRKAEVEFQGTLQQSSDGSWHIGGIALDFDPEKQILIQHMCGPVRVQGVVARGEFQVLYLTPSCLSLEAPEHLLSPIPTPLIFPGRDGAPSSEPINRYLVS
ncbi:MAG: hypothetical protein H0T73_13455 [Ardenticatenales bacterium]|nr:hypothetical protein [Ardenticatenales bacterium]